MGNQLVFVHIPKTAGTAIEDEAAKHGILWGWRLYKENMNRNSWWHNPDHDYKNGIPSFNSLSKKFTVVRNPYDRIVSEYNYNEFNPSCINDPRVLNEWVKYKLKQVNSTPDMDDNHFVPQWRYVFDKNGNRKVNHVIKYENLKPEFDSLMKKYNLPMRLPIKKNSTARKKCTNLTAKDLDMVSRRMIQEYYRKDFELFGYKM